MDKRGRDFVYSTEPVRTKTEKTAAQLRLAEKTADENYQMSPC